MAVGRRELEAEIGTFMDQYGRTSRRGGLDPNDRKYDRKVLLAIQNLSDEELARLILGVDEDE